ncbi:MAG: TldD/PmbA family protein [Nitrospirota bacterium]|nr:TldD/PmbA family protein [Nitrospirota bacterium]
MTAAVDTDIETLGAQLTDLVRRMETRVPYAAVLVTDEASEMVRMASTEERVMQPTPSRGAVFTVHTGHFLVETATDDLSPESLEEAARATVEAAVAAGVDRTARPVDPGPETRARFETRQEIPWDSIPLSDRVAHTRTLRDSARGTDARVVNAFGMVSHTRSRELFVNRTRHLFQDLARTQAVLGVTTSDGAAQAALHDGRGRRGGWEATHLPDGLVDTLVADCLRITGAPRLEAGYYDCIFSPEFSGIFAHEAFGHGTEGDMFPKKRARGEEFLGQNVATPKVDMYDDPSLPGASASFYFDHEGQTATRTQIIDRGTLVRPLTDLHTAHALKLPRTANGRRESFARKAYTRMTNTFFGPGDDDFADMLADIRHGYYLERPSNGMEDPKSWGIQLEGYMASEIVDGKLTGRVFSPVIVTGYVPELLRSITMVGKGVDITGLGMCGKGYKEWVKVTDGGPHLRLKARLA